MLEITGWAIIAVSFFLIGIFGYKSDRPSAKGSGPARGRMFFMIIYAILSALVLNGIASQVFMKVEIGMIKKFGSINEDQMQPDMSNLMAGLIMFGWAFFLAGLLVARLSNRNTKNKTANKAQHPTASPPN